MSRDNSPPGLFTWFLKKVLPFDESDTALGDFEEYYRNLVKQNGIFKALIWYVQNIMFLFPQKLKYTFTRSICMLKDYFQSSMRSIKKNRVYSFINITGLAIGMICSILILLLVQHELSYDKFHKNHEDIYRVTRLWKNANGSTSLHLAMVAPAISPLLKSDFHEILHSTRMAIVQNGFLVKHKDQTIEGRNLFFSEKSVFDIFTFTMLKGDPSTALAAPGTIVLTSSTAQKYFKDDNPVGKSINIKLFNTSITFKVTGIIEDLPDNSHFHVNFLASFKSFENLVGPERLKSWDSNNYATYIRMKKGYRLNQSKLDAFMSKNFPGNANQRTQLKLQPLSSIHLHSNLESEIEANGNISNIYIFIIIALGILAVASFNFMNLSTAKSVERSKEVGIRKIVGATRTHLIYQFIHEAMFMCFISMFIAIGTIMLILPAYNNFIDRNLSFNIFNNPLLLFGIPCILFTVGLFAGAYPAVFLSAFKPADSLKKVTKGKNSFRNILVIFQFSISIILIISVIVVNEQLTFIKHKKLGLNKENILVLPSSPYINAHMETVKNQLMEHKNILNVSAAKRIPSGQLLDSANTRVIDSKGERVLNFTLANVRVDPEYIPTYKIQIAAGRNFSKEIKSDSTSAFIINETAVKNIGWTTPHEAIGKNIRYGRRTGIIIGVVKDFHFESLYQEISPIIMTPSSSGIRNISIRVKNSDISETLSFLKNRWQKYKPEYSFEYSFLDDRYYNLYNSEKNLKQIFNIFAILSVFISCLGLIGLASYNAEQKTKEIGIRKVLGGSVFEMVILQVKEFSKWVLISNLISWPVAWYVMNKWLKNFAYHTSIELTVFLLAGLLTLTIALLTVSYQAIKGATANPVVSLKGE